MQYTLSTSKCNSNEPNKRFLAIPYENVSNIKKPKILNSDANRIIFLHSTVDWVLHGKILNYFDGKVFFKTSAKCEKKKIQIHSREHCSVFQQCGNLFFFLIISIAIFLERIHYMIPMPFVSEVVTFQICRQDTCREFSLSFCKAHCTILNTAEVVF